jgi:CubicO group peptidase (beta-lactamase class C family)
VALVTVATAAVLTAAPTAPTASANPGPSSKAFDPDDVGWGAVHDLTADEFTTALDDHDRAGYLVVDLAADTFGGDLRLGATFQYNADQRGSLVKTGMTGDDHARWVEWADAHDFRMVDLEVYVLDGARHYAAAWVQNVEGLSWDGRHDLTHAQFVDHYEEQKRLGRMPVDFDAYRTAAGTRYATIWVDNTANLDWRLRGDLSGKDYLRAVGDHGRAGFRQLSFDSVEGSTGGTGQRFGGIWIENRNKRSWLANHDMSPQQYANLWHRNSDLGYRQTFVGRYQTAGGVRYAAIWRANTDRPGWKLRKTLDTKVEALIGGAPGVSVSVVQNGGTVYQRGFGYADLAGGVWMDSDHVLRTASVAKAVAGILTLRLEQQGVLARTDTVASDVPGVPPQHDATTYEQLVSNRGCVRHYADPATDPAGALADTTMSAVDYPSAGAAAPMFWSGPPVAGCIAGMTNSYSTHAYTLAGAGMEAASGGTPVADLLRQRLSDPLGLTTLRQEEPGDASVRRSKIYEGPRNVETTRDQLSWKTLGGGLETTPKDLTRLGSRLLTGAVLSPARVQHMWGGTGWSYAYGFGVGKEGGHRRVAKNGSQRGADSFWLIYPDDGIVIAVMANRQAPGGRTAPAEAIANEIGRQMLAQLP